MNEKRSYTEYIVVGSPRQYFDIGFEDYQEDKDMLKLTVDNVDATEAGYTVVRNVGQTLEFTPEVEVGKVVRIQRITDIDEPFYIFTAGNQFVPSNVDANFKQLLHSQQEVRDRQDHLEDRVIPLVDGLEDALEAADDASKAAQEAADAAADAARVVQGTIQSVESVAALRAVTDMVSGDVINVKAYYVGSGKGGGLFYFNPSLVSTDNGGTIIKGWVRQYTGVINVHMFGAVGDGVANDTVAIQTAIDTTPEIYIPAGKFKCNLVLTNSFTIRGAGKSTVLAYQDNTKPVIMNLNRMTPQWNNDTLADLELQGVGFIGTGFRYGTIPANNDYYGVGRVVMSNVRAIGFDKGVHKVNGNIGNKYYNCDFEFNKYGVYATSNQKAIEGSTFIMHSGCDMYYSCNFSENTIAGAAYYDKTHGTGQWLFDHCTFQFNKGFGLFMDFDIPETLFSPIVLMNSWFEENGGNTVTIDRVNGAPQAMTSVHKAVYGTTDIVTVGGEDYKTRMGIGVLNPKRNLHIHDAGASIIQLTTDYTGSADANKGGLIYFTYPDLVIENKEGGALKLTSYFGKVEINDAGNFVSRKGAIGYGKGAGGQVTQVGAKDRTVVLNAPSGRITTANSSLVVGEEITFIFENSYINDSDVIVANVRSSPSNNAKHYSIAVTNHTNGSCQVSLKNNHNATLSEAIGINFVIIKGSLDPVY